MSVPLVINGVTYNYPQQGDTNWGPTLTSWSTAVTMGMLQKAGGNFTLTAEVNFGATYGLISAYYKSREVNISATGILRLANASTGVSWRNAGNSADLALTVNSSNQLTFDGTPLAAFPSLTNTHIYVGNASNVPADVAMSGDTAISNTGAVTIQSGAVTGSKIASNTITNSNMASGTLTDSSVNASAAIALSKLAALNAFVAPVTDSSGFLTNSSTTATEIGYVHGVTSNIQTQINTITGAGQFVSGMGMPFFGASIPSGWLLCDGSAVSRSTYSSLFSAIGTTYGVGDGSTTFNIPTGTNYTMVGAGGSIVASLGATAGTATHVISSGELPTHNHGITDPGHAHDLDINNGVAVRFNASVAGSDGSTICGGASHGAAAGITASTTGISTQNAGSSTAMSLVQPSLGINWIIKT